jgi:hypothetical protein
VTLWFGLLIRPVSAFPNLHRRIAGVSAPKDGREEAKECGFLKLHLLSVYMALSMTTAVAPAHVAVSIAHLVSVMPALNHSGP